MPASEKPNADNTSVIKSDVLVIDIDSDNSDSATVVDIESESEKVSVPVVVVTGKTVDMNGNGTITNQKPKTANIAETVQKAREAFNRGVTKPVEWRRKQLKNLLRMYEENRNSMVEALHKDLRRSKMEAILLEVDYLINDLKSMLHHLDDWVAPTYPGKGLVNVLDDVVIYNDPYGVALVIGAWNYPLQLLLLPMAGAIAAGNAVIAKPSEVSEACAKWVAETLPKYLDNEAIFVVEGGAEETSYLLKQKFDYIFYTGSTSVGRLVYKAATDNLTPVTLELGGKSPVYVDNTADLEVTAKRILWGKFINVGQTCIAPDYVLCSKEIQDKLVDHFRNILKEWYGDEPQKSPDLCRIVNSRHFSRLQALVDASKPKIVIGGNYDPSDKFIEPTIVANVTGSDKLMDDEIFGPILPIVPVENAFEAIKFINAREKPLTLYIFSADSAVHRNFMDNTTSGSVCVNDTVMQMGVETLPFGGVGNSGMGAYHGKATFDTFTHKKSCLVKNFAAIGEKLASGRYPPYTDAKLDFIVGLMRKRHGPSLRFLPYLLAFGLGAGLSYAATVWYKMATEENV